MTKELEAIRDDKLRIGLLGLKRLFEANAKKMTKDEIMAFDFTFINITNALIELQTIKGANPSEALECLETIKTLTNDCYKINSYGKKEYELLKSSDLVDMVEEKIPTIKQALQRLEAIDNVKPSEALEYLNQFINEMTYCLEHQKEFVKGYEKQIFWKYKNTFETTIKATLLKAQEQEKALEIIKKKNVKIDLLYASSSVEQYNDELIRAYGIWFVEDRQLTQEEFDLLKRWLEND